MPRRASSSRPARLPGPCLHRGRVVLPVAYVLAPEPMLLVILPGAEAAEWVLLREVEFPLDLPA